MSKKRNLIRRIDELEKENRDLNDKVQKYELFYRMVQDASKLVLDHKTTNAGNVEGNKQMPPQQFDINKQPILNFPSHFPVMQFNQSQSSVPRTRFFPPPFPIRLPYQYTHPHPSQPFPFPSTPPYYSQTSGGNMFTGLPLFQNAGPPPTPPSTPAKPCNTKKGKNCHPEGAAQKPKLIPKEVGKETPETDLGTMLIEESDTESDTSEESASDSSDEKGVSGKEEKSESEESDSDDVPASDDASDSEDDTEASGKSKYDRGQFLQLLGKLSIDDSLKKKSKSHDSKQQYKYTRSVRSKKGSSEPLNKSSRAGKAVIKTELKEKDNSEKVPADSREESQLSKKQELNDGFKGQLEKADDQAQLEKGDSKDNFEEKDDCRTDFEHFFGGTLLELKPENLNSVVVEILKAQIDDMDKLKEFMNSVFEKAIKERSLSGSYAQLCHRLANEVKVKDEKSEKVADFRTVLIEKVEEVFLRNVINGPFKWRTEEEVVRDRSLGTVIFIGELYKVGIVNLRSINIYIASLLDPTSNHKLEGLCYLLEMVGKKYDDSMKVPIDGKQENDNHPSMNLDKIFREMQQIANAKKNKIHSFIRSDLQRVIDLRKNNWIPQEARTC